MSNKRIWIVTELFFPEETAVAYIFTRLANHLSKSYKINVICGPEFYDSKKDQFVDDIQVSPEIEIFRTKSVNLDKNSLIQRTVKITILSFRMGLIMMRKISKEDIVILSTNPALLLLLVRIIKYFKRFQLHILVHDVFPENTIPAKIFKNNKAITFRMLKLLFDKAYACSEHLIVIGNDMKQVIEAKVSPYNNNPYISIVPNWADPEKFIMKNNILNKSSIILQYAGNVGRVQGLEEILNAFKISNNQNLHLRIRGSGALYSYVEEFININSLQNVNLSGSFSRMEENDVIKGCDIGIVSLSDGMFGLGVPSKTYHLLAAGKPILYIGVPGTEISDLVLENGIGWSIDIRNQNDLINFFNNLSLRDKDLLTKMGAKSRSLAESKYAEYQVLDLFQSKMESVMNIIEN